MNPKTIEKGKLESEEPDTVFVTPESERIIQRISVLLQDLSFLSRVTGAYVKYLSSYTSGDRLTPVSEDEGVLRFSEEVSYSLSPFQLDDSLFY